MSSSRRIRKYLRYLSADHFLECFHANCLGLLGVWVTLLAWRSWMRSRIS